MKPQLLIALYLVVTSFLTACGPRGSGFSRAENALTASPFETIDLRAADYELPEATPLPEGPIAGYDMGDSSGGRMITLGHNPIIPGAFELQAAETEDELEEAILENEIVVGASTTIADETSEGDAAAVTAGDARATTDTADTITDSVVDPGAIAEPEAPDDTVGELEVIITPGEDVTATDEDAADSPGVETAAEDADAAEPSDEVLAQAEDSFDWQALGEQAYTGNCAACHQANGQGVPGAFPPLVEHMSTLYNAEGGREYLINVVLYGLQGEINVLGQTYNGVMPPWSQLSNEQIAAILNHELTSWGNDALLEEFTPILPDEVEAERANTLTAAQVLELRPELP